MRFAFVPFVLLAASLAVAETPTQQGVGGRAYVDINVTFKGDDGAVRPLGDVEVGLVCANSGAHTLRGSTDGTGQVTILAPYGKCQLYADSPGVVDGRPSGWQREVEISAEQTTVDLSSENILLYPVPVKNKQPSYPRNAYIDHVEGKVILQAVINKEGMVDEVTVLSSSNPVFDDSAIKAVKQRRYKPALQNGQPVAIHYRIRIDFRLGSNYLIP